MSSGGKTGNPGFWRELEAHEESKSLHFES